MMVTWAADRIVLSPSPLNEVKCSVCILLVLMITKDTTWCEEQE